MNRYSTPQPTTRPGAGLPTVASRILPGESPDQAVHRLPASGLPGSRCLKPEELASFDVASSGRFGAKSLWQKK